jgi:hypothetical protein
MSEEIVKKVVEIDPAKAKDAFWWSLERHQRLMVNPKSLTPGYVRPDRGDLQPSPSGDAV